MKMSKTKIIKGRILVETGLHIGGTEAGMEIGGMDNPIIKHPVTKLPYVPGSSLKGKMRSLLEWKLGKVTSGKPCACGEKDCPVCRIFGKSADSKSDIGPSRLIVRDAFLSESSRRKFMDGMPLTEDKAENTLDRITAMANPRNTERVVPGVEFDFEMIYRVFDLGDGGQVDEEYFKHVLDSLRLVENDCLGGGGSRGSGKVKFVGDAQEGKYTVVDVIS